MFFAPPKVKSLSRYAEFGTYLSQRDFFVMLAIAAAIHLCVIAIYSMVPHQEVVRIPVRVMNIKLGGGMPHGVEMPSPDTPMPGQAVPAPDSQNASAAGSAREKSMQSLLDKAFAKTDSSKPTVYDPHLKHVHPQKAAATTPAEDATLATPKKYVREGDLSAEAGGKGRGGSRGGKGGSGDEIIQRYEQTISLWISQHKTYPEAAKSQGIEGDAIVRIRIDRDGRILYTSIDRSSGNALIDAAVTAMVQASNPVPRVPEDYPDGSQLEFLIPVSFRLQ